MGLNPYTMWALWFGTWHLGMSKTYIDWADHLEGWDG